MVCRPRDARPRFASPVVEETALAESLRVARRFDGAERRLPAALPEDPLENDALVAVLALYLHEPA